MSKQQQEQNQGKTFFRMQVERLNVIVLISTFKI